MCGYLSCMRANIYVLLLLWLDKYISAVSQLRLAVDSWLSLVREGSNTFREGENGDWERIDRRFDWVGWLAGWELSFHEAEAEVNEHVLPISSSPVDPMWIRRV